MKNEIIIFHSPFFAVYLAETKVLPERRFVPSALFLFISVYSETFLGVPVIRRYSESQS